MTRTWAEKLTYMGLFVALFGVYLLFLKEPAANQAQLSYRIGIFVLGVVLAGVGFVMQGSRRRGGMS